MINFYKILSLIILLLVIGLIIFAVPMSRCSMVVSPCEEDSTIIERSIFIGHPRTNNDVKQSVLKSIEKIDFSNFELTLLGGDLTVNINSKEALVYLDSIFDLSDPNTLLSRGNHDYPSTLLHDFTKRPSYYAYSRKGITYLILDTEEKPGNISNDQLKFIKKVTDTISHSKHLIVMHHRIIWMIGNKDLAPLLSFVGNSTKQILKTNFYKDIYPLLVDVKEKGLTVICVGGDRTNINIEYISSDNIQFIATGMQPNQSDDVNYVVVFEHNICNQTLSWLFEPLIKIKKKQEI